MEKQKILEPVVTESYDPYKDDALKPYYGHKMHVWVFPMPDQRSAEATQWLIQEALVQQNTQMVWSQSITHVSLSCKLIKCEVLQENGKYTLRTVSVSSDPNKGAISPQLISNIVGKQFAQGVWMLFGKEEQQTQEFNKLGM